MARCCATDGPNKRQRLEPEHPAIYRDDAARMVASSPLPPPVHAPRSAWITVEPIGTRDHDSHGDADTSADELRVLRHELILVKRQMGEYYTNATDATVFRSIRRVCDPYAPLSETTGLNRRSLFMNRSAMKLANMDYLTDFALSTPLVAAESKEGDGGNSTSPLTFVDLCGAPGGFGEYLVWRNNGHTRGYGMSLVGENDQGRGLKWKRQERIDPSKYRVCNGSDGTGDVCNWENIQWLKQEISSDLQGMGATGEISDCFGVDLVVADGGTDAQRNSEFQEQISLKLFVCQVAAGLNLLRPGGSLVVKAFGFATETSRAVLMDLTQRYFHHLTLVKPITSRPASAERYLIAQGFRGREENWEGRRWMSRMFLDTTTGTAENSEIALRRINDFEGEMLTLNLDACRAILRALKDNEEDRMDRETEVEEPMHLFAYRQAWDLP